MEKFPSLDKFYTHAVTGVTDNYQVCLNQVVMFGQVPLLTDLLGALLVLATVIAITFEKQVAIIIIEYQHCCCNKHVFTDH